MSLPVKRLRSINEHPHPSSPLKPIRLQILKPVLEEYQKINLNKQSKQHRIRHTQTSSPSKQTAFKGEIYKDKSASQKWQKSIDQYMEARQRVQAKKGEHRFDFQFRRLDKMNRFIYIKLVSDQALPPQLVQLSKSRDQIETEDKDRLVSSFSFKSKAQFQSRNDLGSLAKSQKTQLKTMHLRSKTDINDKIMAHFVTNYFKHKFRLFKRPPAPSPISHSLQRYNTE